MARFELVQRCWPTGSFRSAQVAELLELLTKACGLSGFETMDGEEFRPASGTLEQLFQAALKDAPFREGGADVDIHGRVDGTREYIRCDLHTGTKPGGPFIDHYNVDFGKSGLRVSLAEFKGAVQIMRPFEAFLAELNNEDALDAYTRQQQVKAFEAPAIIRSFHYLDAGMAANLGGVAHCLRAPANRVEEFLDGVLIELIDGSFDVDNPRHREVQSAVMQHLGLPPLAPPAKLRADAGES